MNAIFLKNKAQNECNIPQEQSTKLAIFLKNKAQNYIIPRDLLIKISNVHNDFVEDKGMF